MILCPQSNELDLADDIRNLFDEIKIVNICRCKPQNRNEFKEWGESWPIIYRPTELSEERDRGITVEEHQIMESNLRLLTKLDPETNSFSDRDAIIVNPDGNKVNY